MALVHFARKEDVSLMGSGWGLTVTLGGGPAHRRQRLAKISRLPRGSFQYTRLQHILDPALPTQEMWFVPLTSLPQLVQMGAILSSAGSACGPS